MCGVELLIGGELTWFDPAVKECRRQYVQVGQRMVVALSKDQTTGQYMFKREDNWYCLISLAAFRLV